MPELLQELQLPREDGGLAGLRLSLLLQLLRLRVLQAHVDAVLFDTAAATWVLRDEVLVLVHPLDELLLRKIVQVAGVAERLGDWGAEVAAALLHNRQLRLPNHLVVVHDGVVQGKLAIRDHLQDSVHLLLGHPSFNAGEVGPETHARANRLSMQHARWELVTRAPRVSVRVRSALVGLPKVAVFGTDVALHGLAHDEVTDVLELGIVHAVTLCAKLCLHRPDAVLLKQLEETQVLHHRHLNDLRDAVAEPPRVKGLPEAAVRDGQHRRMVGT